MKVLRVVPYLDFGGVEQVLYNSVPYLIESSKFEVLIVVLGSGGRVEKGLLKKGVTVNVLNQNPKIPNFRIVKDLYKYIKSLKPDVVHCQGGEANFHGLIAARLAQVPIRIGEEIGLPNHHSYWKYIFRFVYLNATRVIAISSAVKNKVLELREVDEKKIDIVYNPIEYREEQFEVNEYELLSNSKSVLNSINFELKKPFVFIVTCRLVTVKNLERLISAFTRLCRVYPDKFINLWIVGDGPLKQKLENLAKVLGISDKVIFFGFQEDVFSILKRASVFVLPSLSEGSSVSLVEAMSVGLPSIVSSEGGSIEIVEGSNSSIVVNPMDENSIFDALRTYLFLSRIEFDLKRIGAREKAKEFSNSNYLKSISKLYDFS